MSMNRFNVVVTPSTVVIDLTGPQGAGKTVTASLLRQTLRETGASVRLINTLEEFKLCANQGFGYLILDIE